MKSATTTNHTTIQEWAEARDGKPSIVKASGNDDSSILRIDFPGYSGDDSLEAIPWDQFFEIFDREGLRFLYQEKTAEGAQSHFNKFIAEDENS